MTRTPSAAACAAILVLSACADGDPVGPAPITDLPRPLSAVEEAVVRGSNAFALGLLGEVRVADTSANTFLSPLSASMALAMTMNGAGGDTWRQMREVLGFGGLAEPDIDAAYRDLIELLLTLDPSVETALANAVWTRSGLPPLTPEFRTAVEGYFGAEAREFDFADPATVDSMNAWVEDATKGRVRDLFSDIPPDIVMFLVDAVYFKADWRSRFERSATAEAPFRRADGRTVTVQMMRGPVGYRTLSAGPVSGVELPYGGGAFTAVALLPPADQPIDDFVASLDATAWDGWMAAFDAAAETEDLARQGAVVRIPRFELEWSSSLEPALRALGMVDAFEERLADLSRLTGSGGLYVTDVLQKSWVRVDEEGTEAAAATEVAVGPTSAPQEFVFDRPFVFAIRERFSGAILFLGVIGDP